MKRRLISIILILMMLMSFCVLSTSCIKENENKTSTDNSKAGDSNTDDKKEDEVKKDTSKKSTDKIQLWYYDFSNAGYYTGAMNSIIEKAKKYCEENDLPVEFIRHGQDDLSHDDYIFKRNLSAIQGNMIVIEDARFMHGIATQHADYTKLKEYDNLLNAYKNRFCIPLGIGYRGDFIDNKVLEYYDIDTSSNSIITYTDYLGLKQLMKENGARFELNYSEYYELINYYQHENGLLYINDDSDFLEDKTKFKEMIRKTASETINDIIVYNDGVLNMDNIPFVEYEGLHKIYDATSDLILKNEVMMSYGILSYHELKNYKEGVKGKTFVLNDNATFYSPSLYIHKKVTNDSIYDLADYLANEDIFKTITPSPSNIPFYTPVLITDSIKKMLNADDDWKFQGDTTAEVKTIIDSVYDIIRNDDERLKQMADTYFSNKDFNYLINEFISELIIDVGRALSGNQPGDSPVENLSLINYNPTDKEINDLIDKKIEDFINNFHMHNF